MRAPIYPRSPACVTLQKNQPRGRFPSRSDTREPPCAILLHSPFSRPLLTLGKRELFYARTRRSFAQYTHVSCRIFKHLKIFIYRWKRYKVYGIIYKYV